MQQRPQQQRSSQADFESRHPAPAPIESTIERALTDAMHDVRELNSLVRQNAEQLGQKTQFDRAGQPLNLDSATADQLRANLSTVLQTTYLLTTRLAILDYELNEEALTREARYSGVLYAKYDKARLVLLAKAKQARVWIQMKGTSHLYFDIYSSFDLLPFLLIENALKYSPPDQQIDVAFEDNREYLDIIVRSLGPVVTDDEIEKIFDRGVRGANARASQPKGTGLGLYVADIIAKIHGFELWAHSDSSALEIGRIPHSIFTISLRAYRT